MARGELLMAVDKLVDSTQLDSDLTSVANAIRAKSGGSSQLAFPSGFVSAVEAIPTGGGSSIYFSQYSLTGDTKYATFFSAISYAPHSSDFFLIVRSNGTVAPSTGSYTLNNLLACFDGGIVKKVSHTYASGKKTPDSINDVPYSNEIDTGLSISNGVLTYTSSSTSCIGTTGDTVTVIEISMEANWWAKLKGTQSV
jgi:hypothetical protein